MRYVKNEIIKKLNMSTETRSTERLLQYRRTILKIPSNPSKYFDKKENELVKKMIADGLTNNEILNILGMNNLDAKSKEKICATIRARRYQYNKSIISSTTRES